MFCEKCGTDLGSEENVAFCPNCGNPMGGSEAAGAAAEGQDSGTVILGAGSGETVEQETKSGEAGTEETTPVWSGAVETVVYCPQCGAQNKEGDTFCGNCGASLSQTAVVATGGEAYGAFTQPEKPRKKLPLGMIGGVAAIVAVLILAVVFLPKVFSGKKETKPLLYLKDNELTIASGRKHEPGRISDDFYDSSEEGNLYSGTASPLQYTRDGKYIFYKRNVNGSVYDVYFQKAGGKGDDSQRLDSDIVRYSVISKDKIVYIKDPSDRKLYLASTEDKERLASDVDSYAISKDDKYIIWKETDDEEYKLYYQDLAGKKDKEKIDNVSWVVDYSDDFSTLVYVKEEDLYICRNFGEPEKIASEVSQVFTYNINEKLEMYYLKSEEEDSGYTMYDLFDDDMLGADSNMQEPRIEDYQTKSYEDSFWGRREVVKTSDEYYDAVAEYDLKRYRDRFRESLKEQPLEIAQVSIYYYKLGADSGELMAEIENLEDGIQTVSGAETPMLFYYAFDLENMDKLKLSKWSESGSGSFYEEFVDKMKSSTVIQFISGKEMRPVTEIEMEDVDDLSMVYNKKTDEIYVAVYTDDYDKDGIYLGQEISLNAWDYKKEGGKFDLISEDISYLAASTDNGVYYFCEENKDGDAADLYLNETKIDSDVYPYSLNSSDDDRLLYLKDIDSDQQEGELYSYYKGKTQKIAGDCAAGSYGVVEGGKVAYLSDYSFKRDNGDLMLYNGKDSSKIDTDVTCVFLGKTRENRGSVK